MLSARQFEQELLLAVDLFMMKTCRAGSLNNDILLMSLTNVFQAVRKVHGIKCRPGKIGYSPAGVAYEMVMLIAGNFKTGVTFDGLDAVN